MPLELVKEYSHFTLLGAAKWTAGGAVALRKISGNALPAGLGQLALHIAALESGVRPLYVVVSVRAGDHKYHKAPNTEQIAGFENLIKAKPMSPRQGGAGLRERWIDERGRRIFEWDSQHGELEIYLASDGSHIGAFSHITGEQLKGPKKKRNIKKYL